MFEAIGNFIGVVVMAILTIMLVCIFNPVFWLAVIAFLLYTNLGG